MSKKEPSLSEKLAALHIEIEALRGRPIADWEVLRQMTPSQILQCFAWHHVTYDTWIEDARMQNHPSVLTPLYVPVHRERTAKIDVPTIAKSKRIRKTQAIHVAKMAEKRGGIADVDPPFLLPRARPKQKIKSRGFQGSRGFDGSIRWRDQRRKQK